MRAALESAAATPVRIALAGGRSIVEFPLTTARIGGLVLPLAGVALTVDSSVLTAIGNDYGYEEVFARQVRAIGQPDDVLLAISTSGQSPNVLAALAAARDQGLTTIALVGAESNPDLDTCDLVISIPDSSTARIQEMHLVILHLICDMVDIALEADSLSR